MMMRRLGSKAGTQNIDRILRLPGTTNLPNAKKHRDGRVARPAELLWFNGASYPLEAFPREQPHDHQFGACPEDRPRDESGSGWGFRFMRDCHTRGLSYEQACAKIRADEGKAGEWANRVNERQLKRAWEHSRPDFGAAPPFSEEDLALAFADRHANTLRYVAEWGQWFMWNGTCWCIDRTRQVFTLARELCREIAAETNSQASASASPAPRPAQRW
jgi:hypothetical protein